MSNADERIDELSVLGGQGSGALFTRGDQYVIPLYQRPYAWGEDQILQLIEDIYGDGSDAGEGSVPPYYLGSLIVYRRGDGRFEVVDGQQRLTTLFLLVDSLESGALSALRPLPIDFDCRPRSNRTLENLGDLSRVDAADIEAGIYNGRRVVEDALKQRCPERLKKALQRVRLYRIEVPAHTDLNRYFEVMNTRGEQLEQHEVLKASMMSEIESPERRAAFAAIWNACSDMTGYVQMHFGTAERKSLFGSDWESLPAAKEVWATSWSAAGESFSLLEAVEAASPSAASAPLGTQVEAARFESIIEFPFLLMHALRVFVHEKGIVDSNGEKPLDSLLDDRKLAAAFERVCSEGLIGGEGIDRSSFAEEFAVCLLRCRYLFDRYIIKREATGSSPDGAWSLKSIAKQRNRDAAYYKNSRLLPNEWEESKESRNRRVLMLQACLRVSYTSPRVMHWITSALIWLSEHGGATLDRGFEEEMEAIAIRAVAPFLQDGDYRMGVNTPHIVLNYLDYLLWKRGNFNGYEFEFRTSIEHWYPQNPSEWSVEKWDDADRFGNLCLMHRGINSKFSNLSPASKAREYASLVAKGTPKLQLMSGLTNAETWRDSECAAHEDEMLSILRRACGLEDDNAQEMSA